MSKPAGGRQPGGKVERLDGAGRKPAASPRGRRPVPQQLELPVLSAPSSQAVRASDAEERAEAAPRLEPFRLIETSPGKHSLLLTDFEPAGEVFARYGVEAGGYAWEAIARHILEDFAMHLRGRLGLDPESSMFCAYGEDAAALAELGGFLAALFHQPAELASLIERLGPDAFLD